MVKSSVIVDQVGKKFGLSLNSALKYGLIDSGRRILGRGKDMTLRPGEFWALDNVSLTLEPGDALGVMGVNGSGKTTLLRILNGTYTPDKGKATLRGRIGALIAAGAGFSPMLTGRENVFISGTLLGMTPSEIKAKFDEIVNFAELEDFIDMPVRNYSSGMSIRLGFAVAGLGSPEILLVDEVLAVGDLSFQKKCFDRIHTLKREGTTILFVSHSPGAVWAICNKGMVIHRGHTDGIIPVEDACKAYDHFNTVEQVENGNLQSVDAGLASDYGGNKGGTGDVLVTRLEILDSNCHPISNIPYGKSFVIRQHVLVNETLNDTIFRIQVDAEINKAIAIIDSYETHRKLYSLAKGPHIIDVTVSNPNLRPGIYTFAPSILIRRAAIHLFFAYNMASLAITQPADTFFYADFRSSVNLNTVYELKPHTSVCYRGMSNA